MENIADYAERMLSPFEQSPFNAVDSLILSWITCLNYPEELAGLRTREGIRFGDLFRAEFFGALFSDIWNIPETKRLFTAMAASPRFRNIRVKGLVKKVDAEQEKQFSAMCWQLSPGQCYVAYRGTDATLTGWKEDFNMAFKFPVPSQKDALDYLCKAAGYCQGELLIGGHSKGGNLAVYASANCPEDVKKRIGKIYSHDGPGFLKEALESEAFHSVSDRLDKTIPQSSLVGLLMEQQEQYRIIRSNKPGILQHDPLSWEVNGTDFCASDTLTPNARYQDKTLNGWALSLTREERERFVDSLYQIISAGNSETVAGLWEDRKNTLPSMAHAAAELDPTTRKFVLHTLKRLIDLGMKNIPELWRRAAVESVPSIS